MNGLSSIDFSWTSLCSSNATYTPDLRHEISKDDDDRNEDVVSPPYRERQINSGTAVANTTVNETHIKIVFFLLF